MLTFSYGKKNYSPTWMCMLFFQWTKWTYFIQLKNLHGSTAGKKIRNGWIKQFIQSLLYAMRRLKWISEKINTLIQYCRMDIFCLYTYQRISLLVKRHCPSCLSPRCRVLLGNKQLLSHAFIEWLTTLAYTKNW